ncbi:MAG: hypothetical protein GX051_09700 [Clostridiales bacterium]|nr:hypothetical protein [Clostridiales bacterium]
MKNGTRIFKTAVALMLAFSMVGVPSITCSAAVVAAASAGDYDYTIGNAYADVDWDEWKGYKTQLHCHSNVSDGELPLNEVIEEHYRLDYDILAVTDHMTLGTAWDVAPEPVEIMRLIKKDRTGMLPIVPLTSQRRQEILTGVGRDGRPMLEITTGVELNGAVPSNSHLNGYFADYGQGLIGIDGDYETPVKEVDARGGITFLDHLGNYTQAYSKEDPSISSDPFYVNKFSRIFLDYSSCLGMGLASGSDTHTTYDRILYDNILKTTIPYGRVPWSFTFSDAHSAGEYDRAYTIHWMPELTVDAFRDSMENGTFFSFSQYSNWEIGNEFKGEGAAPTVNRITVDDNADTITIDAENYDAVTWVSDGKIIATGATIDLDEYSDEVGCYVRAYLTGPGGVLFVQPFTTEVSGQTLDRVDVPDTVDYSRIIRIIISLLNSIIAEDSPIRTGWENLKHLGG